MEAPCPPNFVESEQLYSSLCVNEGLSLKRDRKTADLECASLYTPFAQVALYLPQLCKLLLGLQPPAQGYLLASRFPQTPSLGQSFICVALALMHTSLVAIISLGRKCILCTPLSFLHPELLEGGDDVTPVPRWAACSGFHAELGTTWVLVP